MDEPLRFVVWGQPVSEGSMLGVHNPKNPKRPFVRPANAGALKRWRAAISKVGIEVMDGRDPLDGPLRVILLITIGERPASRRGELYPATRRKGDADKFERAIFDGLGGAGQGGPVIADDGLIVDHATRKRWCGIAGGLAAPGVRVTVERMPVEAIDTGQ
jgi:Holliday junction resolvase RusA-like endonuclease